MEVEFTEIPFVTFATRRKLFQALENFISLDPAVVLVPKGAVDAAIVLERRQALVKLLAAAKVCVVLHNGFL